MSNPIVTIQTNHGTIQAELYPDIAPNTVNNFIYLIQKGFYDGLTFHRVIPGFMIQGGDPEGTGTGGPGHTIEGEFFANGIPNPLNHTAGVLSMARSADPNSAGSQFFIMVDDAPHLDGKYAAFGKVTQGLEEAVRIANVGGTWRTALWSRRSWKKSRWKRLAKTTPNRLNCNAAFNRRYTYIY